MSDGCPGRKFRKIRKSATGWSSSAYLSVCFHFSQLMVNRDSRSMSTVSIMYICRFKRWWPGLGSVGWNSPLIHGKTLLTILTSNKKWKSLYRLPREIQRSIYLFVWFFFQFLHPPLYVHELTEKFTFIFTS